MAFKKRTKQKSLARSILCCIALMLLAMHTLDIPYRRDRDGVVLAILICCGSMDLLHHGNGRSYKDSVRNISLLVLAFGLRGVVC